jgi:hypothetical protein
LTITILNSSGSTVNCWVDQINEVKTTRTVINDLPLADYNYVNDLGTKNRTFIIDGGISGSAGNSQVRALSGTTGSIAYVDAWGGTAIAQTQLFFSDVKFTDKAEEPMIRKFSIDAVEVL